MKLIYEKETRNSGRIILESEPQYRSIFVRSNNFSTIRLPFPYIYFTFKYHKSYNGVKTFYEYPGYYGRGLRICSRLTPIKSFEEDRVFLLPIENGNDGYTCTDHQYDGKNYPSVTEMVNEILSVWWGHQHVSYYSGISLKEWSLFKLEELHNLNFYANTKLLESYNDSSNPMNEQWPCGM